MNSSQVLSQVSLDTSHLKKNIPITSIQWKVGDNLDKSFLFYKITNSLSLERLKKYWKEDNSFILITNRKIDFGSSEYIAISDSQWMFYQKKFLDIFYPFPKNKKIIGITGTNGKTSTAYFTHKISQLEGNHSLYIGSLGVFLDQKMVDNFHLTSPSYIDFRKIIFQYQNQFSWLVVEVSSHSLAQDRYYQVNFDAAGWLSFSQDHLDYHQTMEEYLAAKKLIFKKLKSQAQLFVPMEQTDLQALIKDCDYKLAKSFDSYDLTNNNNIFEIQFNRENFSVAYEIVNSISPINNPIDLSKIEEVPGRFNILEKNELKVVIDSAHTPDALENVCKAIQKNYPNKEIRAVFGCGGDRDKDKRPKMAQILKKYCDYLYITSDNPRYEDPDLIIDDIVVNLELNEYYRNRDRTKAITYAIDEFKSGVLLIAGKGHEDYIIIKEEYTPYSDFEAVKNCFKKW